MILSQEITILRQVDISEAFIRLRSDGIIHVDYKKNTTLDVQLQTSMRKIFDELSGGKKIRFIFSAAEGLMLTKEARENKEILDADSSIEAYAIIANNLAYKLIANFYLKVNKPKVPYKLFSSLEEAVQWLYTQ